MGLFKKTPEVSSDRRKELRRRVLWGARLAQPDGGHSVKCVIRDISPDGARVHLDDSISLVGSVYLLDMQNRLAYEANVVWRHPPEFGLKFLRLYRFDEVPSQGIQQIIEDFCRLPGEWVSRPSASS